MEQIYNKLVRDKIPEKIKSNNEIPYTRILTDEEFEDALLNKIFEEGKEIVTAKGKNRIEELADLYELIKALALLENSSIDEVIKCADLKKEKRGAFDKRIYLEKVIEKD